MLEDGVTCAGVANLCGQHRDGGDRPAALGWMSAALAMQQRTDMTGGEIIICGGC